MWLTRWADFLTPKDTDFHPVHYLGERRPGFHSASTFVLKYGRPAILQAIHSLTTWRAGPPLSPYRDQWVRCWNPTVVSPARRLNAEVRDLNRLSSRQEAQARR